MSHPSRPIHDLELSDAEVTEILDGLDADEINTTTSQRRSSRRFLRGTALIVTLSHPDFAGADYRVRLRNVSRHGVAFLSRCEWEPGTRLRLQLPIGEKLSVVEKAALIVRCRRVTDQICEIGADFEDA